MPELIGVPFALPLRCHRCNPESLDWEAVPSGYVVGGLVSKSRPRGVRGPEARVYQLAFIFGEHAGGPLLAIRCRTVP